jgi:hypothetical protein
MKEQYNFNSIVWCGMYTDLCIKFSPISNRQNLCVQLVK